MVDTDDKTIQSEGNESVKNTNEEIEIIADDVLNINISSEEVLELTEQEASIVAQKIEVELERYENILIKGEAEYLSDEELIELGFDQTEYERLKKLEKEIYKHIKKIRSLDKESGLFAALPWWIVIFGIVCAIFNVFPINPWLPTKILQSLATSIDFTSYEVLSSCLVYFIYIGLFYIPEIVIFIIYLRRRVKNSDKKNAFRAYLIIFIIDLIVLIPGLVIFMRAVASL